MTARTPAELFDFLDGLGIRTATVDHPPLRTVEESRVLRGRIAGAHTKNLLLKDKKSRLFLVVAEEDREIDLKRLHGVIGAQGRLSFVDEARMTTVLGVRPGSVTAFALINDTEHAVTLVLDDGLPAHDIVNCHPLVNTATTTIAFADLMRFFEATGHRPVPLPFGEGERSRRPGEEGQQ